MITGILEANGTTVTYSESGEGDPVVLVHSSASSRRQWRGLGAILDDDYHLFAPDLQGYGDSGSWHGREAIRLSDQADLIGSLISRIGRPVHLVGHSFGGAVALRTALEFQDRLSSLTLIEPTVFQLFREDLGASRALFDEVCALSDGFIKAVSRGDYWHAMSRFVDYWNGAGTWQALPEDRKNRLSGCARQIALDFWSAMSEDKRLDDYRGLAVPTLLLCGTRSPAPVSEIARLLTETIPDARHRTLANAGHMAPITHPALVAGLIRVHLVLNQSQTWSSRQGGWAEELRKVLP